VQIYIAGINGMVGSAIATEAMSHGHEVLGKSSAVLNLINRELVFEELNSVRPDVLVIAAAKVGGIVANSEFPVDFLSINLQIQTNLLDAAHSAGTGRVIFLGSSCIYPKFAQQPISESALLTGELESTNAPYAIAKIAGLKLVESYRKQYGYPWISIMPTNLYGPRDNFNPNYGHVLPSLLTRIHKAKIENAPVVEIWGDGTPLRELLYVDDLARACVLLFENYNNNSLINIGSGEEISISDLANAISRVVGYEGDFIYNRKLPNGTPRKLLNSALIRSLGWKPFVSLESGLESTYKWFRENQA
jgi:GDP-L-fucose synthase